MGSYKLVVRKTVGKDLRGIPNRDVKRIVACFDAIAENPRSSGFEKLSGLDRYRARVGVYRIIYEIHDVEVVVVIVKVGHRREVYRSS